MTRAPRIPLAALGIVAVRLERSPDRFDETFNPWVIVRRADTDGYDHTPFDRFLRGHQDRLTLSQIQSITDHLCAGTVCELELGGERITVEVAS